MTKEEAKRFAEVLLAYSRGEPVQFRTSDGVWVTYRDTTVAFQDICTNYRLPPPSLTYRNWLHLDTTGQSWVGTVYGRLDYDCKAFALNTPGFVRWLGDWQEVEL